MAFTGTPLSLFDGVFAMEEEEIRNVFPSSSSTDINLDAERVTSAHGFQGDWKIKHETISERRRRRKARAMPMPHKDFSLENMNYNLDTPYRQKSLDLPTPSTTSQEIHVDDNDVDDVIYGGSDNQTVVTKSARSKSEGAALGETEVVCRLQPEYVRWFYKSEDDRQWIAFTGYDSTRLEEKYLQRKRETEGNANKKESESESSTAIETIVAPPSLPTSYLQNVETKFVLVDKTTYFPAAAHDLESESVAAVQYAEASTSTKKWYTSWMNQETDNDNDRNSAADAAEIEDDADKTTGIGTSREKILTKYKPSRNSITSTSNSTSTGTSEPKENVDNLVHVRGGLYECNIDDWTCTATYWPDTFAITRGTWFYDGSWQPLPNDHATRVESEHLKKFKGTPVVTSTVAPEDPDGPPKVQIALHRVSFQDFHVDWMSPTEIHLYSKAGPYQFMRSVGQRLGFQTWGHRLCRGYMKPASLGDRPSEISHVVFVIHGIGQKMDTGRIVRNCATFRDAIRNINSRYFPQQQGSKQRAEFFPVEWRSFAKLDGDIVQNITPKKLLPLRQLLNATAMDIMYYTSPLYRTEIQCALRNELKRIYTNFLKRNPNFEARGGKISIMAHSLGAVIAYDIITGYECDFNPIWSQGSSEIFSTESTEEINHEGIIIIDDVAGVNVPKQPKGLPFKLEHFFCLGSPLSVFLALRWREPHNPLLRSQILPHHLCKRFYNVFHPSDPVAYRIEPLLNQAYTEISPMCINSYNASIQSKLEQIAKEAVGRECYYTENGCETENNTTTTTVPILEAAQSIHARLNPFIGLKSPPTTSKDQDSGRGWWNLIKNWKNPVNQFEQSNPTEENTTQSVEDLLNGSESPRSSDDELNDSSESETLKSRVTQEKIEDDLEYRIDYVLRESNLSNSYLAALTSHTGYWSSPEIAFFILSHLHSDLIPKSDSSEKPI